MKKAEKIKLFAFDVDGTLTPGYLVMGEAGEISKIFHARDGLAIALAHRMGYITGFITGRKSPIVENRGKELAVDFVLMGVSDKVKAMEGLLGKYGLSWEEAAYMGDDLNDLPLMEKAGLSACPEDGVKEVKRVADFISPFRGGNGAARAFIEKVMKAQNRWKEAVDSYRKKVDTLRQ